MSSKYGTTMSVPKDFPSVLKAFTREVRSFIALLFWLSFVMVTCATACSWSRMHRTWDAELTASSLARTRVIDISGSCHVCLADIAGAANAAR